MKDLYPLFALLASYVMYSRMVTIPAGVALNLHPQLVFIIVFVLDMCQVPVLMHLYEKGTKISFLKRFNVNERAGESLSQSRAGSWAKNFGSFGVIIMACIPCVGGGMWTAVLLARALGLSKKRSYVFLCIGSLIGCLALTSASKLLIDTVIQAKDMIVQAVS